MGQPRKALQENRIAGGIFRHHAYVWGEARALALSAQLHQRLGHHGLAARAVRRIRRIAQSACNLENRALLEGIEANRLLILGKPGHADRFRSAVRGARAGRNLVVELRITLEYCRTLLAVGQRRLALPLQRRAAARARKGGYGLFARELARLVSAA
jgi:hypothetical protein